MRQCDNINTCKWKNKFWTLPRPELHNIDANEALTSANFLKIYHKTFLQC